MNPLVLASFTFVPEGSKGLLAECAWVLVVLPMCLSGIGLLVRRLPRMGNIAPELLPAVGVAGFVFAGGLLNLAHLAVPSAVLALLVLGLAAFLRATRNYAGTRIGAGPLLLSLLVAAIMAFTAATQLEPLAYNWQDDLQKYLVHPVRMLETGTVFGSPLSAIGNESLGGIAFMQAAVLIFLPLKAINAADAVLGLFLCLVPLVAFGIRNPRLSPVAAVAVLTAVMIDPFYVNASALYLGSALILAAVVTTSSPEPDDDTFSGGSPFLVGLLYAGLVALKPTLLLFAALHWAAVALAVGFARSSPKAGLRWALKAAASGALFLAPWILVHLPHLAAPGAHGTLHPVAPTGADPIGLGFAGPDAYTRPVAALAFLAVVCACLQRSRIRTAQGLGIVLASVVTVASYPMMRFVFPRVVGYADADTNALRYFTPLAIAVYPIVLCIAVRSAEKRSATLLTGLGLALLACVGFSESERLADIYRFHTMLPYPGSHSPVLAKATEYTLGSAKEAEVRSLQDKIPPGASVVAWIYAPYFLDFSRNTVYDAEIAGISNRWAAMPKADYYLWEFRGSPDLKTRVRRIADTLPSMNGSRVAPLLAFENTLTESMAKDVVVFKDPQYVLVRVAGSGN